MPLYATSNDLYAVLKSLFEGIRDSGPQATSSLSQSKMVIHIRCREPQAEVWINGKQMPVSVHYGPASYRPDLEIDLSADAFDEILMGALPLKKAIATGKMKVRGALWKTRPLEDILHRGQELYPHLRQGQG